MNLRFLLVLVLTIMVCSGCFLSRSLHKKTVNLTVAHVPNQGLRVKSTNGRIELTRDQRSDHCRCSSPDTRTVVGDDGQGRAGSQWGAFGESALAK